MSMRPPRQTALILLLAGCGLDAYGTGAPQINGPAVIPPQAAVVPPRAAEPFAQPEVPINPVQKLEIDSGFSDAGVSDAGAGAVFVEPDSGFDAAAEPDAEVEPDATQPDAATEPDAEPPPKPECVQDTDCSSTAACTDAACVAGACVETAQCGDDGNACTVEYCDLVKDQCVTTSAEGILRGLGDYQALLQNQTSEDQSLHPFQLCLVTTDSTGQDSDAFCQRLSGTLPADGLLYQRGPRVLSWRFVRQAAITLVGDTQTVCDYAAQQYRPDQDLHNDALSAGQWAGALVGPQSVSHVCAQSTDNNTAADWQSCWLCPENAEPGVERYSVCNP